MGIAELKRETGMVAPEWSEGERSETSRNGGATIPVAAPATRASGRCQPRGREQSHTQAFLCRIQASHSAGSRPSAGPEGLRLFCGVRVCIRRT